MTVPLLLVGNDADGQSTSNRMEVRPLHGDPIGPLSNGRELASNLTTRQCCLPTPDPFQDLQNYTADFRSVR